ncbi:MAG: RNA polymerase sigma factor [Pirellulales bacterium]
MNNQDSDALTRRVRMITSTGCDKPIACGGTERTGPPPEWITEQYHTLHRRLWCYVKRRVGGRTDIAGDILQDAFAALCREPWPDIREYVVPWLYRTCRNRTIDFWKREGRMSTMQTTEDQSSIHDQNTSHPGKHLEEAEQLAQLRNQIDRLPDQQQEVLRLRLHDGLSYKQIAEVTGLTVTNVGYHLHQAVSSLRKRLVQEA